MAGPDGLEGKLALVTGGASGIGRASAAALATAGAQVFVADIDETGGARACEELRAAGAKAEFARVDLTDDDSIHALADTVLGAGRAPETANRTAADATPWDAPQTWDVPWAWDVPRTWDVPRAWDALPLTSRSWRR